MIAWTVGPSAARGQRAWRLCLALARGDYLRAHHLYRGCHHLYRGWLGSKAA